MNVNPVMLGAWGLAEALGGGLGYLATGSAKGTAAGLGIAAVVFPLFWTLATYSTAQAPAR